MNKKINFSSKGIKCSVEIEVHSIKKKIESIINTNSNVIFLIDKKVLNISILF